MFETLASLCFFIVMGTIIGLPVAMYGGYFGWMWLRQRRIRARMLREACMICDGDVNEAFDGTYTCPGCGFDAKWRDDAAKKAGVEEARELRQAVSEFQMGLDELERSVLFANANVWGLGRADQKYLALESAEGHFIEGHRQLDHLVRKHPELQDFPFPTEAISDLASGDRDGGGLLGVIFMASRKRAVRDRIVGAHRDATAAVGVLTAMLSTMGDEIKAA